jgi:hypothetical protein
VSSSELPSTMDKGEEEEEAQEQDDEVYRYVISSVAI